MRTLGITGLLLCALALASPIARAEEQGEKERLRNENEELREMVVELRERIRELEAKVAELGGSTGPAVKQYSGGSVHDSYDRFTGARSVRIDSHVLRATHKDDPTTAIDVLAHWLVSQDEGSAPRHVLLLRHRCERCQWRRGTDLIMLVDGVRHRTQVVGTVDHDAVGSFEYIEMEIQSPLLGSFTSASKVEVRAGAWELEIPGPLRTLIAEQVRKSRLPASSE